jgi:hypothetical protein
MVGAQTVAAPITARTRTVRCAARRDTDPTTGSARNLRNAIAIDDRNAVLHDNLGRLWTNVAHDRESHGDDPEVAVARALSELDTAVTMDATRVDARAAMR